MEANRSVLGSFFLLSVPKGFYTSQLSSEQCFFDVRTWKSNPMDR